MVKQIIWSNLAQENRREILKYWINHNKSYLYSRKLNKLFKDSVILISKHPKSSNKLLIRNAGDNHKNSPIDILLVSAQ